MKIALADKKVLDAFLNRIGKEGRVLTTDGNELRGAWSNNPLIAKWDKKDKLLLIPSDDKGVRKAQSTLRTLLD